MILISLTGSEPCDLQFELHRCNQLLNTQNEHYRTLCALRQDAKAVEPGETMKN